MLATLTRSALETATRLGGAMLDACSHAPIGHLGLSFAESYDRWATVGQRKPVNPITGT